MNDDVRTVSEPDALSTMKREIDALQIAVLGNSKPWYRNVSTLISAVALLFSFSTTYVSYRRSDAQDVQARRQELRALLQRLSALPKENLELTRKYAGDPAAQSFASSSLNQENAIITRQAVEIARALPNDQVTATDYYALAYALQSTYEYERALEFYTLSLDNAKEFGTEIAALRSRAILHFLAGRAGQGRVDFQRALSIFDRYPNYDAFTKASTNTMTEMSWSIAESNAGQPAQAMQHLDNADRIVAALPSSPGADSLRAQTVQTRQQLRGSSPVTPAATLVSDGPPPAVPPKTN